MPPLTDGPPDVLALGVGGTLGEAWMLGVLAGLEDAAGIDMREAGGFIGTSAGSIVSASLASGMTPRERLGRIPQQPAPAPQESPPRLLAVAGGALSLGRGALLAAAGAVAPLALRSTAGGGALVRRVALGRAPRGSHS